MVASVASVTAFSGLLFPGVGLAGPSQSAHSLPAGSVAGVSRLCGPSPSYQCTGAGYAGKSEGWPGALYGRGYASSNRYGLHNCTLYVAYRLWKNGLGNPGWSGNATLWDTRAPASTVNRSPAVGSVAQWNRGYGHVAYVEKVTSTYIEISDDNYGLNYTDRFRISRSSAAMPDNFIHLRDVKTPTPPPPSPPTPTPTPSPTPSPTPTPKTTPSPSVPDRLSNDGRLLASKNEYLRSADGRYRFVMQQDSNLVLYGPSGRALWASNTVGRGAKEARMQGDGNLVIYTSSGKPIWASNTAGHYHAYLVVQNDGNVVIYEGHKPLWATGTDGRT